MTIATVLYAAGSLLEGFIAAMLFIAWRALRHSGARWPGLLAAGFCCNCVRCGIFACGFGNVPLDARPLHATACLSATAVVFITAALIDYIGIAPRLARRLNTASTAAMAVLLACSLAGWLGRGEVLLWACVFFIGWIALFVHAMAREPRSGHGLVVIAIAAFPAGSVAANLGLLPFVLLPTIEIVPLAAIGLIVLTTGLVRAHQRAQRETAVAARALTARELAEAQLRAVNETLEQRVAMRTAELRETVEGLDSFNRSVSHDLRGPLGGIAGLARLARDHVADGKPARAEHLLAAIERQADTSARMVAALLALARAGDAQPHRTRFDAGTLLDEIVAARAARTAGTGTGGTGGTGDPAPQIVVLERPVVDADRELLRQVFVNLIDNACKFAAGAGAPRVEVGCGPTPQGRAFFVRDNGVGFASEDAARLFKPFQRLHGARYEGFGIGLSIVRRIVDHHGGLVWAEGRPGAGATFWFTLGEDEAAALARP